MLLRRKGEPVFYKQAAAASTPNGRGRRELFAQSNFDKGLGRPHAAPDLLSLQGDRVESWSG
jgi:hypothetical protein